ATAKQQLPQPTGGRRATRLPDGGLLIVGGHDDAQSVFYSQAYAYNVGQNSWSALPSLQLGRSDLSAVTAPDGRVYAIGGYTPSMGHNEVEAYRPGSAGWISVSDMNLGRDANASAIGPDGRIYAFGGRPGATTADASAE